MLTPNLCRFFVNKEAVFSIEVCSRPLIPLTLKPSCLMLFALLMSLSSVKWHELHSNVLLLSSCFVFVLHSGHSCVEGKNLFTSIGVSDFLDISLFILPIAVLDIFFPWRLAQPCILSS